MLLINELSLTLIELSQVVTLAKVCLMQERAVLYCRLYDIRNLSSAGSQKSE
jgi:hypothetical protein